MGIYQQPTGLSPFGGVNPPRSISPFLISPVASTIGHPPPQSLIPGYSNNGPDNFIDANEQNVHIIPSENVSYDDELPNTTQVR